VRQENRGEMPPGSRRALREQRARSGAAHTYHRTPQTRRQARGRPRALGGVPRSIEFTDTLRLRLKGLVTLVMVGAMAASLVVLRDDAAQPEPAVGAGSVPATGEARAASTALLQAATTPATGAPKPTTTSARRAPARAAKQPSAAARAKAAAARTATATAASRSAAAGATPKVQDADLPFATNCGVSAILVPSCGAYWGIYSRRFGNRDVATSVTTWERMLGRRFDIVLMYYDFSNRAGPGRFPDRQMTQLSQDRIPLYDWETRDYKAGTNLRWADVAAGKYDESVVIPQAKRLKDYGKPVMLGLDHEMDISYPQHGSPAEYRAMYRHVREVFAAQGVHNVVWVWAVTGWVSGRGDLVKSFYPGDDLVDWVGYDPYNWGPCKKTWKTFDQTVGTFYRWTTENGLGDKPLLLQEYGLSPDPSNPQASQQWYRDIPSVLKRYPRLKALVRWDSDTSCTLRIDAGPGMLEAFKQAGLAVARP
jgi:hypothetical protein